jgi:hypothetical protein
LDGQGSVPGRIRNISADSNQTSSKAHPVSYPQGVEGCFPEELRRLGHEANYSLPSNPEFNNACTYNSTPPYVLMA